MGLTVKQLRDALSYLPDDYDVSIQLDSRLDYYAQAESVKVIVPTFLNSKPSCVIEHGLTTNS